MKLESIINSTAINSTAPATNPNPNPNTNTNTNTNTVVHDILQQLQLIRTAVMNEAKQLADVQLQNTKLTEENQRLQYRIEHISRSIEEITTNK